MDRQRAKLMFAHQEWLGFVQPVGLVVSPNVLIDAQVAPDRNMTERQREFRGVLAEEKTHRGARWIAPDLHRVFNEYLCWEDSDLVDVANHRETLEIALPELQVVLSASWAVPAEDDTDAKWSMLVRVEDSGADLDKPPDDEADGWNASRHARFERLLRETGIPIGLLCTNELIRLIYAPTGESSGHITFQFAQMATPAGKPILSAFDMLFSAGALFTGPPESRLPALLAKSRDAQAEVSTKLSRQVLEALHELLRGFVSADTRRNGSITGLAHNDPEHFYGGLVTTLMRLVFALYAEDRGLMPDHPVYQQNYSLAGLFDRLRNDAAAWPDTMDQRFGAWAQLLSLFRLIYGGGGHAGLFFVARKGKLFDPLRFPFLEGRESNESFVSSVDYPVRISEQAQALGVKDTQGLVSGALEAAMADTPVQQDDKTEILSSIPLIPDATIWKVLRSLMILDGERLSYRTLDVEQIGSVYEAVMGFHVELTTGRSIAVQSPKGAGASAIVNLQQLLAKAASKRTIALREESDRNLTGKAATALRDAGTIEDIVTALDGVTDRGATPDVVPSGTPVLQPTDERRRSGSHYTPRSLTEPIVAEALRPVFERLGTDARPDEILDLKVLDPATGSGAFLVEACRQLSSRLVEAWNLHGGLPELTADEDELLHARRLVAQRCLYGVDRNAMAIDLARLSLWLVTLARDHEFTFVDHALRHGDSLVGLTRRQIEGFHWDVDASNFQFGLEITEVKMHMSRVREIRDMIRELGDDAAEHELRELLDDVENELAVARQTADLPLAAFFACDKPRERERRRKTYADYLMREDRKELVAQALLQIKITPFHWELEFPEVFDRENPGFDAILGNPPFAGKNTLAAANPERYPDWLKQLHPQTHGNSDLVAHFFRRAFNLLRDTGTFGLIATNTIGQGDTRFSGLRWICKHGGRIYRSQRRLKWPGEAAVVVSVVHIAKGTYQGPCVLDGKNVEKITAFLFHDGGHDDPERLQANEGKSFVGNYVLGMGFTFDDTDKKGVATPLAEMRKLIAEIPANREVIFPYIGGEEVNSSPTHAHHRYVINFRDWPLRRDEFSCTWHESDEETRRDWIRQGIVPHDYPDPVAADWPELLEIVEQRAKPQRDALSPKNSINREAINKWWRFLAYRKGLHASIEGLDRLLVISRVGQQAAFAFIPNRMVYAETTIVFPSGTYAAFCALQSRPHEIWARFFSSSLKDDLRYAPSDCFESFPFPLGWQTDATLEEAGTAYYDFRSKLMIENKEGMTKTYNRFHDPDESDPAFTQLRSLHDAMDRAVLDSYGWADIPTECEFLLDYEVDEESSSRKKKPWRYRWPDAVRNELLARLLALNTERAAEERELRES